MSPIHCHECGRANGAAAKKCMWCGLPIIDETGTARIETTRVEIGYLDGIDRFEDAGPVRLIVGPDGIEVAELIPGSRSVKIPASAILEANVVDASTMVEGKPVRPTWWWLALGPGALLLRGRKTPDVKEHDYILSIKYKAANEVRNAVFQREDRAGLAVVEGLARILTMLARKK
ncbi:MAG: hypothetical protein AABN33_02905 [Acidobacteriota bacterium]